ncbi:hypothetical protein BE221DRAFT_64705 [Ostreococcus tauri]|uniref:SnoaL-like domain-containing protein n=1 Tax=Ostreococcus tauri TaxID=70448 RepID=A0A1Y5HX57_OSTTA|nr:hypothetical protein BE221DRAFT_64705 [Ostreococcus tauri]
MSSEADLIAKTAAYFTAWNCHDIAALRTLFSTHIELHDWNVRVTGKEEVIKANADIFDAFPNVSIDIVDTLVCVSKRAVTCEIIVHLNDAANATLIVVDVLRCVNAFASLMMYRNGKLGSLSLLASMHPNHTATKNGKPAKAQLTCTHQSAKSLKFVISQLSTRRKTTSSIPCPGPAYCQSMKIGSPPLTP